MRIRNRFRIHTMFSGAKWMQINFFSSFFRIELSHVFVMITKKKFSFFSFHPGTMKRKFFPRLSSLSHVYHIEDILFRARSLLKYILHLTSNLWNTWSFLFYRNTSFKELFIKIFKTRFDKDGLWWETRRCALVLPHCEIEKSFWRKVKGWQSFGFNLRWSFV